MIDIELLFLWGINMIIKGQIEDYRVEWMQHGRA